MTIDDFWALLEELPAGETAGDALRVRLSGLQPDGIVQFQAHFDDAHARAYDWMLWAAAYTIRGGCSDDSFMDFRYGLIALGRKVYEAALTDPDSLANVVGEGGVDSDIADELFGYVAGQVYESMTGSDMPRNVGEASPWPDDPTGEEWDFDDEELCAQKLPELWAKFGD